ncbi:uncharacterized protein I303_103908 [Kwoniella dejecticola CBS 10117]|uniref:WSC domain-containing protein n=1 Tax=Kwoniella dejecticola CBS 10117 TaxID=1296121 RepID=A0A1A6A822_9TREE|nr:uncharacterized protein I303_03926 [Kwoniella dejecticola CBS 10117]OBR86206.1 hypothetical protein I303_03926 [Kwoniella dejecticola CBS 10117]
MVTLTSTTIIALSLLEVANAAYVGCFDREAIFQGATGHYIYNGENPPAVPCDCASIGYSYSYQYGFYGGVGIYETCFCTNAAPDYAYYLNDPYACNAGTDGPGESYVNAVGTQSAGWNNIHCYHPAQTLNGFSVFNVYECLTQCKSQNLPYAAVVPYEGQTTAQCGCFGTDATWSNLPWVYCGWEDWLIYTYTAQPSGAARRGMANLVNVQNAYCPPSTSACLLEGSTEGSYECINTLNELESCGGCIYGEVQTDDNQHHNGTE